MPAQLRVVRRRIRTVQSTMKITRAQELIAASRVVRAQRQVEQARPYASEVTAALSTIATTEGNLRHPLLERREEVKAEAVLDALLPRYIAVRVFAAMLESAASEWAARRKSMSAATDNAKQLIESLTREYNQARQAAITQEIMEIVGGAEAMQQTGR